MEQIQTECDYISCSRLVQSRDQCHALVGTIINLQGL